MKEEIKLNSKSQPLDSKYIQNELDMIKNEIKLFENKINELFSSEESVNSLQKELTLFNLKIPLLYLLGIPITSSGIGGTHNGIIIELDETKVVSQEQFERYVYVISYFVPSKIPAQIILSPP